MANRNSGRVARPAVHSTPARVKAPGITGEYNEKVADQICYELRRGRSLPSICRDEGMPDIETVYMWVAKDPGGFAERYRAARRTGYHKWAEQTLAIADGTDRAELVTRSQLRIETRQWLLARLLPDVYGDVSKQSDRRARRYATGRKRLVH